MAHHGSVGHAPDTGESPLHRLDNGTSLEVSFHAQLRESGFEISQDKAELLRVRTVPARSRC
ncbi:hypothetical protein [Nesterenkonia flava]|uniref:Uncharacterized protein n=1 Tax=Nesterenkonia flava TaxID=469799 RepID=A0ABU1FVW4_9MICC|nr:hypothetical protein [Nesterenkonia flava]MDR5712819.1 hypothetical protein [Nesterenkonia flava]